MPLFAKFESPKVKNLDYLTTPNQTLRGRKELKSGKILELPENFKEVYHDIMIWEAVRTIFAKSQYRIKDPNEYNGLHIHARGYKDHGGILLLSNKKEIDDTFDEIHIPIKLEDNKLKIIKLTPEMAKIDRYVSIAGTQILKGDIRSLEILRQINKVRLVFNQHPQTPILAKKSLNLKLESSEDAFTIIPCTPAALKFGDRQEEDGVHIHTYSNNEIRRDATYRDVTIGERFINADMARYFAIQRDVEKNLNVVTADCPECGSEHLGIGHEALNEHRVHICDNPECCHEFETTHKVISNPLIRTLNCLIK